MLIIVTFQLKQIFNQNLIFFRKTACLQTTSDVKNVSFPPL